jgi:hypothetical protein
VAARGPESETLAGCELWTLRGVATLRTGEGLVGGEPGAKRRLRENPPRERLRHFPQAYWLLS